MAEPVETENPDLALDRAGTTFVDATTERDYQAWSLERSTRGIRNSMIGASCVWLGVLVLLLTVGPTGAGPWAAAVVLVFVLMALAIAALRTRRADVIEAGLLASLTVSGLVGVLISRFHLVSPIAAVAAAVWGAFFQFRTSYVASLTRLAVAIAPMPLVTVLVLVRDVMNHDVDPSLAAFGVLLVLSAYAIAFFGALSSAAAKRRSFRQRKVIERQSTALARERARTEEMLARELKHQVAERSRELGAVLARSDVSLDVRRLEPGERFAERYEIVSQLGAGGMGVVYEVERITDGQRLALKAVVGEVSGASAARFAREAEIGARVHHANLVSIVDVGVSSGVPFLVMELVRGGSLEGRRDRFGDVRWALPILRQIAEGLAALHDVGAVHRDLKPGNVLLSGDPAAPVAKISDFGISRFGVMDDRSSIDPNAATMNASPSPRAGALTGTGVVLGTPLYMAPEAVRGGRALDASADVWALGVLAYELLDARSPFPIPAPMLVMADQPIPTPPLLDGARVMAPIATCLRACLAVDPAARPRVRDVLDALTR